MTDQAHDPRKRERVSRIIAKPLFFMDYFAASRTCWSFPGDARKAPPVICNVLFS